MCNSLIPIIVISTFCAIASCGPLEGSKNPVASEPYASNAIQPLERELKRDCARLMQMIDRINDQDQYDLYQVQLQACARLIIASENGRLIQAPKVVQEEGKEENNRPQSFNRRAYDYIRFGKRMNEDVLKGMTSQKKAKNMGTHEYIRFGK